MPRKPKSTTSEAVDGASLRHYAVSLLARRDHARAELRTKMVRKFGAEADLEPVLSWCEEHGFLDDRRFAGLFTRSRIERGQGPLRIRVDLQQRGVSGDLVEEALQEAECDWFALAETVVRRRFRQPPADVREKARQLRFLQSRGFDAEQSFQALSSFAAHQDDD